MATKYRLKKKVGGYLALTSTGFARIIKGDEELDLSAEELERLKDYVEPVPKVQKKKVTKKEEEGVTDIFAEDN